MHDFISTVFLIVAALFPIINPPGAAFVALNLIPHVSDAQRSDLARRVALNSFVLLLVSLSIGAYVLSFFGISIPVLRVAGGLVVAAAGWKLLQAPTAAPDDEAQAVPVASASLVASAFYPLTLPITVGPGTIAVSIALGTRLPKAGLSVFHLAGVAVGLVLLCLSIYLCLRFAARFERLLGIIGTQIAMRLFAFILFCIGVQILWLGLADLLQSLPAR